ncbi:MAG: right-handed parallel beta-helix repeat-containing protein [Anaerolineae bacterium]|nr:right-handed parallel beta-helix repeat-containing protein [Anaerolineae bacterium]
MDGRVLTVTTLDSTGPGSLKAAIGARGPRVIVFEVGGVIDLAQQTLVIDEPFVTVAGQTAPHPGITLIRGGVLITTHDVSIRHIRVRPGDAGQPRRSGWEPDGISTSGRLAYNIVIDHCSVTWGVDENLSASGPQHAGRAGTSHAITFSNNIVAEALRRASHSEGAHSKGSLIHDHVTQVAIIRNLYAHNSDRNPYFKPDATGVVANNVIYNPGQVAISMDYVTQEYRGREDELRPARVSVVGNVLQYGPNTPFFLALVSGRGEVYLEDNLPLRRNDRAAPRTLGRLSISDQPPIWVGGIAVLPGGETLDYVLANAGARPWDRDAVDRRIIESVRAGSGTIIDSQEDVGGYPDHAMTYRTLEIPESDVESWLASFENAAQE